MNADGQFPSYVGGKGNNIIFNGNIPVMREEILNKKKVYEVITVNTTVEIVRNNNEEDIHYSYEFILKLNIKGIQCFNLDIEFLFEAIDILSKNVNNYMIIVNYKDNGESSSNIIDYYELVLLMSKIYRTAMRNSIILPADYRIKDELFNNQRILKLYK